MKNFLKIVRLSAVFGTLSLSMYGCGNKSDSGTTTTTTTTAVPSPTFQMLDSRTGAFITIIGEPGIVFTGPLKDQIAGQVLSFTPKMLQGITTLHRSTLLQEITTNAYGTLSPAEKTAWQGLSGTNDPAQTFSTAFQHYVLTPQETLFQEVTQSAQTGDAVAVQKFFFLASQFVFPAPANTIRTYEQSVDLLGAPAFISALAGYSYNGSVLTIGNLTFNVKSISGVLSITSVNGTSITPIAIPAVFLQAIGASAPATVSPAENAVSGKIVTNPSHPVYYIGPSAPNVYRPVINPANLSALENEEKLLKSDPRSVLQGTAGNVPHGFNVQNQSAN